MNEPIFAELLTSSWDRHHKSFYDDRADEVLLGAVIASLVGKGFTLIGLHSDESDHHLRLERSEESTRLVLRLTRLEGRHASFIVGYGERTPNLAALWPSFVNEAKSLHSPHWEPGVISFDADLQAGYLYAQISLILDLDRYLGEDFRVDLALFDSHGRELVDCLRRYLRGRVGGVEPSGGSPPARDSNHERVMGEVIAAMGALGFPVIGLSSDDDCWRVRFRAETDPVLYAVLVGIQLPRLMIQGEVKNYLANTGELLELAEQLKSLPEGMTYRMNSVFAREDLPVGSDLGGAIARLRERLQPYKKSHSPFSQKIQRPLRAADDKSDK